MGKKKTGPVKAKAEKTPGTTSVKKEMRVKKKKKKEAKNTSKTKSNDDFKAAVFDLGGDDSDLKLLEDVNDELEEDDNDGGDQLSFSEKARKELEAYIKELGLDQKFKQVEVAKGGDEDMGDEDDSQSEEDEDDSDEDPTPKTTAIASTSLKQDPKSAPEPTEKQSNSFRFALEKSEWKMCLVKAGQKWHEIDVDVTDFAETPEYWLSKIEKHAFILLGVEAENFKKGKDAKKSERNYIDTVLKSGALGDKISAQTVLLQESPVQNLFFLENLIGMVNLKSRRPCMMALDALEDLFANHLLAPDRKLRSFKDHPFAQLRDICSGNKETKDRYLVVWYYEHRLKELYKQFLSALDEVAKDSLEKSKTRAMSVYLQLLMSNPENEQELLNRLVNKLGDPIRTVAAKAMYLLGKLLEEHPLMKTVVIKEVERILYRPNVNPKAQYYGVCFLSQIILDSDEEEVANRLIQIYFGFFKASVKKGEIDTKLMSALLTGVNRAYPYAKIAKTKLGDQIQVMFRLVQLCPFNTSVQALMLLFQIMDHGDSANDRFYSAIYRKLTSPDLAKSSKQALFLNLLFKTMKKDVSVPRVLAFIKRLLQMCHFLPPAVTCGILFLISEVIRSKPELQGLRNHLQHHESKTNKFDETDENDDDEDEHYEDVKEDSETDSEKEAEESEGPSTSSWVHKKNLTKRSATEITDYDPFHRNPAFCKAESAVIVELHTLCTHFHPSVALFGQQILEGQNIKYSGDPLQDFTLIRFLDRFVFRNPKKDPLKGKPNSILAKRKHYVPQGAKALAPDSREYLDRSEASIPADELFIFRYMKEKRAKQTDEQDSDAESVNSDEFNQFLTQMSAEDTKIDVDFAGNVGNLNDFDSEDEAGDDDDDDLGNPDLEDDEDLGEPDLDGEDDNSDLESLKDEDSEEEEKRDYGDDDNEFDEEGFEMSDDEDEVPVKPGSKRPALPVSKDQLKKRLKKYSNDKGNLQNLLASAEEFADLIDESAVDDLDLGGSGAVSNVKDNATKKQLKWEKKRDEKMRGLNFRKNKGGKPKAKKFRK